MRLINAIRKYYNRTRFTRYFKNNTFGSNESVSGAGSTLEQTRVLREVLPTIFQEYEIKAFTDAPCGDFNWMRYVDLDSIDSYQGLDIVKGIIESNNQKYSSGKVSFQVCDISNDPIRISDLILCRDCLVHLSYQDANKVVKNFKNSGAKYLLTTTFTERTKNEDLGKKIWRTLNLGLSPFNFPTPIVIINESCTEGNNMFTDKSLALYDLSKVNV